MPTKEIRFGLITKDDTMESGYLLYAYLWILEDMVLEADYKDDLEWDIDDNTWSFYERKFLLEQNKFIQFSPFEDKNGRLLKEGDKVYSDKYETEGIVTHDADGLWCVNFLTGYNGCPIESERYEYTGSIYLEKEGE